MLSFISGHDSVLKRDTPKDKKRMAIGEFTNHCRYLEMRQRSQEELAMIGRGELKVSEEYSDLCCEDVKFFRKSEDQMRAAHSNFLMLTYVTLRSAAYSN
jgi:hypothetical protein